MQSRETWLTILCPNCSKEFSDDMPALKDGASFTCPNCEAEITITMTWHLPETTTEAA